MHQAQAGDPVAIQPPPPRARHMVHISLANFPAVFFHICGFDICHETQHNTKHKTDKYKYQNDENKSQLSRAID